MTMQPTCLLAIAAVVGLAACAPNQEFSFGRMVTNANTVLSGELQQRLENERTLREENEAKLELANRTNRELRKELDDLKAEQSALAGKAATRADIESLEQRLRKLRRKYKCAPLDPETERLLKELDRVLSPSAVSR
jgi:septal ring factor EnvC (AmiA/AmiB activator)